MARCVLSRFPLQCLTTEGRVSTGACSPSMFMRPESIIRTCSTEKDVGLSVEEQTRRLVGRSVASILYASIEPYDIDIRPDGLVFLPEIKYRRILNRAFGPGGWALLPQGEATMAAVKDVPWKGKRTMMVSREFALFGSGHVLARGVGEQEVFGRGALAFGRACESTKSKALVYCCMSIGMSKNLKDSGYVYSWKKAYAHEVLAVNPETMKERMLWKRIDCPEFPPPWKKV